LYKIIPFAKIHLKSPFKTDPRVRNYPGYLSICIFYKRRAGESTWERNMIGEREREEADGIKRNKEENG